MTKYFQIVRHYLDVVLAAGLVLLIIGVGVLLWLSASKATEQASIATTVATFVVALFAVLSAWQARRQADATTRAVEIAVNTELNSATPVIRLEAVQGGDGIRITYSNIGKGPALMVQIWILHDEFPHLMGAAHRHNEPAFGVGRDGVHPWTSAVGLPELRLGADIVAQYQDVFRRVFESRLSFTADRQTPTLNYGLINDPEDDIRV